MTRLGTVVVALTLMAAVPLARGAVPRATTNAAFVAKANRACAAAGAQITRLPKLTSRNLAAEIRQETAIATRLIAKLRTIEAPPAKRTRYKRFVDGTEREASLLRAVVRSLQHGRVKAAKAQLAEGAALGKRSDRDATALGLPACAKDYEAKG